jgi:UDP-glucose 4-epimerase
MRIRHRPRWCSCRRAVYGEPAAQPVSEDAVPDPRTPYGQSKLAAEHLVAAQPGRARSGGSSCARSTTLAPSAGSPIRTGPGSSPRPSRVAAGTDDVLYLNGDGTEVRELIHVDDLGAGISAALNACQPGECPIYNIGSGLGASLRDIVAMVESVSGRPVRVEHRPPAAEPRVLLSDSALIRRQLGWQPARSDLRSRERLPQRGSRTRCDSHPS